MLAIMVVKQWIRDGKPKTEYEGIRPWLSIIQESLRVLVYSKKGASFNNKTKAVCTVNVSAAFVVKRT